MTRVQPVESFLHGQRNLGFLTALSALRAAEIHVHFKRSLAGSLVGK
jgi:hypothetical protein